jgi:hypothetical protein
MEHPTRLERGLVIAATVLGVITVIVFVIGIAI